MAHPRVLLLSNSTMANTRYLEWPRPMITEFLRSANVQEILFVPFAGVRISWDEYADQVQTGLPDFKVNPIHKTENPVDAVNRAQAIMVGGGNTFHLLYKLYQYGLLEPIRRRVMDALVPYVGWSAGSNVAGPDIGSTNDMPIIWPESDRALNLVPYNINPHYSEWTAPGFKGETRIERLRECVLVKKRMIVAMAEGVAIRFLDGKHVTVAPPMAPESFSEGQDRRCVKLFRFQNGKDQIQDLPLGQEIPC